MGLDNLAGNLVDYSLLKELGLLQPRPCRVAGGQIARAEVAELPIGGGVEVEAAAKVGDRRVRPAAETALAHVHQHVGQQRRVAFAVELFLRHGHKMATLGQLGTPGQPVGHELPCGGLVRNQLDRH